MTTNKPKVVAYARTGALASILPHPWKLPIVSDWSPMYSDALIRLSDYEALQAECEELREALVEARDIVAEWGDYASDYFKEKHDLARDLERLDAVIAAQRKQGGEV